MPNDCYGTTGKIYLHKCDEDFSDALLGETMTLGEDCVAEFHATETFTIEPSTKHNHRNLINHIYSYQKVHFPEYYAVGVCNLTSEELNNQTKYYWKNKTKIWCAKTLTPNF